MVYRGKNAAHLCIGKDVRDKNIPACHKPIRDVTHSNAGEGLLFYGDTIVPFVDNFPKDTELYRLMTTRPSDKKEDAEE